MDELIEADELGGDRRGEMRDPQRGEVIRYERRLTVEVLPRDLGDRLIRQTKSLQHRHNRRAIERREAELDVRQHPGRVALTNKQRPGLAGGLDGEPVTVDQL